MGSVLSLPWALLRVLRMPKASRVHVLRYQNTRLRKLLRHAFHRVPYYRRRFQGCVLDPREILTVKDLARVPMTSTVDLDLNEPDCLLSRGAEPERGIGGEVRRTWAEVRLLRILRFRVEAAYGMRFTDRRAAVVTEGEDEERLPTGGVPGFRRVFRLEEAGVVPEMARYRPQLVEGSVETLDALARYLSAREGSPIRPRILLAAAEAVPPDVRARIRRAFRAPVLQVLGLPGFPLLAWQCRVTGDLHVCDDGVILEVLREGRPARRGERGELVATDLHGLSMPLVRMRLGSTAVRGPNRCSCGVPFSTIRDVRTAGDAR